MNQKPYSCIVIDGLEYFVTREIERAMYNNSEEEKSLGALYDRIMECINARRELNYEPIYNDAESFLDDYGYDEAFIKEFLCRARIDKEEQDIISQIKPLINNSDEKKLKDLYVRLESCVNSRIKHNYEPILKDVEDALKKYGFKNSFIKSFLNLRH